MLPPSVNLLTCKEICGPDTQKSLKERILKIRDIRKTHVGLMTLK